MKLGIRRFAAELAAGASDSSSSEVAKSSSSSSSCCDHEIYVECGWCFYYPTSRKFSAATQLCVRVAPEAASGPVLYRSGSWDLGWLFAESSGYCCYRRLDPYTLEWEDR